MLNLQPKRDDMRRLLEVLPAGPELPTEFTNSIGMRFVLIEPGDFIMGSNESADEMPPISVEITRPLYLSVFPVTQAQYQAVTGTNPSQFIQNAAHPVEQVSWNDAVAYCEMLNHSAADFQHEWTYRLPTEAEWEYACRAGSTGKWCFGDDDRLLSEYAWFYGNSNGTIHPVGEKKANASGLHDMHGNVWEWCADWYDAHYYEKSPIENPQGPTAGSSRVLRGGGFFNTPVDLRCANRADAGPSYLAYYYGFRVAMSPSNILTP